MEKDKKLEAIYDEIIATKLNDDGYFDLINGMTPEGMLALVSTVIESWMEERVKPETNLIRRYTIIDDWIDAMKTCLRESTYENFRKARK